MAPKRPHARTRQTKISFSPASKVSPKAPRFVVTSESDSDDGPSRPAKRQRMGQENQRGMNLGMPATQNRRGMFGSSDNEIVISSGSSSETSEDYGERPVATPPKKRGKQAKTVVVSDDEEEVQPKRTKRKHRQEPTSDGASEETSEGEVTVVRRKDKRSGKKSTKDAKGKKAKRKAPTPVESTEDDSEDQPLVTPRKRTQNRKKHNSDPEEESVTQSTRLSHRKKRKASTPESEGDAEEQQLDSDAEADELKEDLAFLQSSPLGLGSTQSKAKTGRAAALDALKKRRAANNDPPSSSAGRKKPIVVDSDSESDLEIAPEENDEVASEASSESVEEEFGTTAQEALYGNEEDESFINDDDAPIGVPSEHALPLQFSSLRNAKPRDLFKYAIEWMVQKKLNPAFASDDEIYQMTFRKLDDEVSSLASSKYHSSVWTKDFTRAIRARPEHAISEIDSNTRAVMEPHCEACNRKSHTASFEVIFSGAPYQKDTLEPLAANASDSESGSDSSSSESLVSDDEAALNGEKPTYDERGERIPPESKTFALGSTCKGNMQVAHTLYHWRYHLNSWVVDYLGRQGHCSAEQLVARDKWSVRKRQKFANKVVDEMETNGEIKRLHKLYKDQVNWALEADNEWRGWNRRG